MNGNKSQQTTKHELQTTTNPARVHNPWAVLNTVKLILKYHYNVAPTRGMNMPHDYRKISNIRRTKSQNWNDSHLVLKSSLPNPLKPGVKSRMKM